MENTEIGTRGWLGNPFVVGEDGTREEVVAKFEEVFVERLKNDARFAGAIAGLEGKRLSCWCQRLQEEDGQSCHAEVIAKWADKLAAMDGDDDE